MSRSHWCGSYKIPSIGIGTWEARDASELEVALNAALEVGYRHIDTAFFYDNEHVIGKVINEWISSGKLKREDLFIVTKLPMQGVHRDRVETFLKKSLESLNLDYVDLYLVHFPVGVSLDYKTLEKPDHQGVWQKMEQQVYAGRARAIGVSNFNVAQIEKILEFAKIKPACNQFELHLFLQQPELVNFCQAQNIRVVAFSPLGCPDFNKFCRRTGAPEKQNMDKVNIFTHPTVTDIAKKYKKSNAQVALRFLLQQNITVIPKSVHPERLRENFDIFDFELSSADIEKLKEINGGENCRILHFLFHPDVTDHPDYPIPKEGLKTKLKTQD